MRSSELQPAGDTWSNIPGKMTERGGRRRRKTKSEPMRAAFGLSAAVSFREGPTM
ncbi:hypothetical protein FQA47_025171 [Oryzias melastigma]|uniref:Uncharacterized protein n=1 Tax=Oryzias melastigma TaxID=30732 RepID=A0A834CL58_ORYME|nr:hypothetical protein FQA47_025171 [Oryzias melastigma]